MWVNFKGFNKTKLRMLDLPFLNKFDLLSITLIKIDSILFSF